MTRPLVRLTSAAVEKRGVGTLTDPAVAGLMLRVRKTSTRGIVREFRFRYKFKRRTGVITLGNFPGCRSPTPAPGHSDFAICCRKGSTRAAP